MNSRARAHVCRWHMERGHRVHKSARHVTDVQSVLGKTSILYISIPKVLVRIDVIK